MLEKALEEQALEQLAHELGDDPEPVRDLIQSYLAEAPISFLRLRAALTRGSPTELASAAHALKSSSAMLGALTISHLAIELEKIGRSGNLIGASEKLATMDEVFPRVERELRGWMSR